MTTHDKIREWLDRGRVLGATHMIVVCDTFDHSDYPVYVRADMRVRECIGEWSNPAKMSRVMEVYSYARDLESQLHEPRAWHVE